MELLNKLKDSVLIPATYKPSNKVKNGRLVVLTVNNKPVIALGSCNDNNTKKEAKEFLKSKDITMIMDIQYPNAKLEIYCMEGTEIKWKEVEEAIAKSEKGCIETDGEGELQWIVFGENAKAIATALCVSKEVQNIAIL